jgi:hypothetical protein
VLISIPFISAEESDDSTYISVEVTTEQDINSVIVQNSEGDINTDVVCNGATCTTNIHGGTVEIPPEQQFSYNDYRSEYFSTEYVSRHSTASLSTVLNDMGSIAEDYYYGNNKKHKFDDAWSFWGLLDTMFVSHKEYQSTLNNVEYLGNEVDTLKAQNNMLMNYLNISFDEDAVECNAAIEKAKRTGEMIESTNGWIAESTTKYNGCIKVLHVKVMNISDENIWKPQSQ